MTGVAIAVGGEMLNTSLFTPTLSNSTPWNNTDDFFMRNDFQYDDSHLWEDPDDDEYEPYDQGPTPGPNPPRPSTRSNREEEMDFYHEWMQYMETNHFAQMLLDETIFSMIFGTAWLLFGIIGFFSNVFIFVMMMTKEERESSQGIYLASLALVDILLSFSHMFRGGVVMSVRAKSIDALMNDTLTSPAGICVTEALENPFITTHAWIIVALMIDCIVSICLPVKRQIFCTVTKAIVAVVTLFTMSFVVQAYSMSHLVATSKHNLSDFKGLDYAYKNIKYAFIQHCAHASRSEEGSVAALVDFSFTYAIPLVFVLIATIGLTIELKKRIDKTRTADTYDEANIVLAKICRINRLTITMVCLFAHFLILHAPKGIWVLLFGNIGPPEYQAMPKLDKTIPVTGPVKLTPKLTTPAVGELTMSLDPGEEWRRRGRMDENFTWPPWYQNMTDPPTTVLPTTTVAAATAPQSTMGVTGSTSNTSADDMIYNISTTVKNKEMIQRMDTTTVKPVKHKHPTTAKDDPWDVNATSEVPVDPTKGLTAFRFCQTLLCLSHTMNLLILVISSMYFRRLFYLVICHRRVHFGADLSRGSSLSREALAARLGTGTARPSTKRIKGIKHSSASTSFRGPAAKVNFTFNGPPQNLNLNGPSPNKPASEGANGVEAVASPTSPTELILKEASMKLSSYADK